MLRPLSGTGVLCLLQDLERVFPVLTLHFSYIRKDRQKRKYVVLDDCPEQCLQVGEARGESLRRRMCYWKALNSSSQHRGPVLGAHAHLLPCSSPRLACKLRIFPAAQMTCGGPCEHGHGRWSSWSIKGALKMKALQLSPSWGEKLVVKLVILTCCACAT